MNKNPSGALHPMPLLLAWAVIGFGLTHLWPIPFSSSDMVLAGGKLLWGLSALLVLWTQLEFWKHKTTDNHSRPTTAVITSGPFRYSRHPVYVAFTGVMVGTAIVYESASSLLLAVVVVVAIQRFTVVKEEAYLEREFGDIYRDYKRTVRQWI